MENKKGICIITLSDNYDHQEVAFSMFNELYGEYNVYNIGLINQKNPRSPKTERSFYFDAPRRPGINKRTFKFGVLRKIVKKIKSLSVNTIYFESEHIWNAFIMKMLGKKYIKVEVIHDVIPHSDSKGKKLANKVTCKLADKVVIRNLKYKNDLMKIYKVPEEKIIYLPLWRYYPNYKFVPESSGFLFFGRIRKYKGINEMLKIAINCPNIQFKVVGAPDDESKSIVEKLRELPNVIVVEKEVDDTEMEKYFRNSKAIILPYESATQSGVIVDSYKYSKPVIAYNVGAISEQVQNNYSGFLVNQDDIDQFCTKIKNMDEMKHEEYEKICINSYNYGYERYSSQSNKKVFIDVFFND